MPVTRRGSAATPKQALEKLSPEDLLRKTHHQTHSSSRHSAFPHSQTAAKRKAPPPTSPCKTQMTSLTMKPRRKQAAVREDLENAASSKRHKANPTGDQNGEGSLKADEAHIALKTGSKHDLSSPPMLQSPSRPPLVPRTPATADRTGRVAGMQSC